MPPVQCTASAYNDSVWLRSMETRRLKYFVRIAEDGSLTKASGVLRIAQPALSRQLRLLEEELGVSLFRRISRGMQLTEEGEHLRVSVAGPLRELELALQNIRSFSSRVEGNVTIGMPSNIGDTLARPLVIRINLDLPNIKLRIVEGPTGSLIDWLNRGMVDFALLEEASSDDRLSNRELRLERLMLIGAAKTSLNSNRSITFREAARLPLVVPSHHLGIRSVLNTAAIKVRKALNICFEADSARLMKELVENGMGYAILPRSYFRSEHLDGRLKCWQIINPTLSLTTFLSRRNYNQSNPAISNVIESKIIEFFGHDPSASPRVVGERK